VQHGELDRLAAPAASAVVDEIWSMLPSMLFGMAVAEPFDRPCATALAVSCDATKR
jgi:hypothetical protein